MGWRKWIWILLAICLLVPCNFSISTTPIRLLIDRGVTQEVTEVLNIPIEEKESILKAIWNANCISNCENIEDTNILSCIEKAKLACNIKKHIPVYYCSTIYSPMMMGIFRTILVIPKQKYEEKEFEVILKHECTHYQSKDLWYKAFMTLISDIYWFNPIVLLMKRQAFKDLELVCDQSVVKAMDKEERALYSNALVHVQIKYY